MTGAEIAGVVIAVFTALNTWLARSNGKKAADIQNKAGNIEDAANQIQKQTNGGFDLRVENSVKKVLTKEVRPMVRKALREVLQEPLTDNERKRNNARGNSR